MCAASAGGAVSTRDFVSLRHWGMMEGGVYVRLVLDYLIKN